MQFEFLIFGFCFFMYVPVINDNLIKSSVLPWASRHYNLGANHISIMWDRKTIGNTIGVLRLI